VRSALARTSKRRRNRRVTRCRDGSSSWRSVNVHPQAQQRKRRLRQIKKVRLPAIGRSRTRTTGRSFTSQLARLQPGQQPPAAASSTSRSSSPPRSTTAVTVSLSSPSTRLRSSYIRCSSQLRVHDHAEAGEDGGCLFL